MQVTLAVEGPDLVLTVRDDGSGFEPKPGANGMGTANLAARAQEVGGLFELISIPQRGTTVRFAVPCGNLPAGDYLKRAALWGLVLLGGAALLVVGAPRLKPWGATSAAIALIAVMRYAVASYRVRRGGLPA